MEELAVPFFSYILCLLSETRILSVGLHGKAWDNSGVVTRNPENSTV